MNASFPVRAPSARPQIYNATSNSILVAVILPLWILLPMLIHAEMVLLSGMGCSSIGVSACPQTSAAGFDSHSCEWRRR